MSARPRSRKAPQAAPAVPRRAERAAGGGLLRRFVERLTQAWRTRVETGGSASEVRIDPDCDRDGAPPSGQPLPLLLQQRNELSARLLVHDPARHVVRNLFIVHDELRNGGWAAVEALPAKIVDRALIEAEILATDEPSAMLDTVLEDLRRVKAGADARAELDARDREWETMQVPEVLDSDFGEFEMAERSWAGTVPAGLEIPNRRA